MTSSLLVLSLLLFIIISIIITLFSNDASVYELVSLQGSQSAAVARRDPQPVFLDAGVRVVAVSALEIS